MKTIKWEREREREREKDKLKKSEQTRIKPFLKKRQTGWKSAEKGAFEMLQIWQKNAKNQPDEDVWIQTKYPKSSRPGEKRRKS